MILYTLVSGSLPFDGANLKELRERVLRGKYRIPFYMSTDCENLLKRFLVLNPTKRASLEVSTSLLKTLLYSIHVQVIMKDKWMNIGCEDDELKPYIESEPELNDQRRIDALAALGLPREDIEESLRNRKYDDVMANYLLLGKRLSEADQSDSRSSSSLSLRGLRPPLEVAASNGQSPAHVKVQRSVSATTKPRRFSHGGDSQNQNAVSTSGNSAVGTSYKRQNTLDVVKEKPENSTGNGPPSPSNRPSSKPTTTTNITDNSPITPVLNTTKITGIGSLRQTQKTTTPSPLTVKNTFSGIPRRNTYNYSENKSSSAEKTTLPELPVRFVTFSSSVVPL